MVSCDLPALSANLLSTLIQGAPSSRNSAGALDAIVPVDAKGRYSRFVLLPSPYPRSSWTPRCGGETESSKEFLGTIQC